MEATENRLFDLLETFSFEALTEEDRLFVLSNMTEAEFRNQQKVLVAADQLVYPQVTPLPLALPTKKSGFLLAPIPLYKSLLGAAAAALFVFWMWPETKMEERIVYVKTEIPGDTIITTKTLYDTVFKVKEKILYAANQKPNDTVYLYTDNSSASSNRKMLEANISIPLPALNEAKIKTKGKSLKEEDYAIFLPEIPQFNK